MKAGIINRTHTFVMTNTRNIKSKDYAQEALELFDGKWEEYVRYALNLLSEGFSPGYASERLERRIRSEMKDIRRVLTDYEEVIGNIMADAEKRWIEAEVEKFTKEANEGK